MARRLVAAGLRGHRIEALYLTLALAMFIAAQICVDAVLTYQAERILDAVRMLSAADLVLRGTDIEEETFKQVRELEFVAQTEPAIIWPAAYCSTTGYLIGIAIDSRFFRLRENISAGRMPRIGAGEFLLPRQSAKELGLEVGDRVTFAVGVQGAGGMQYVDVGLRMSGSLQDQARTTRWPTVAISDLQTLLGINANVVLIELTPSADWDVAVQQLQQEFPRLRVERGQPGVFMEVETQRTRAQAFLQRYTFLLVASFGLLVWTLTGVYSRGRRPEWGCLLAAGVKPSTILLAGVGEAGVVSIAGSLVGLTAAKGATMFLERYRIYASISDSGVATAWALAALLAATSRVWHLAQAMRKPIVELIRARE